MKTLESMKQFIRENNFTALVNELVIGAFSASAMI